MAELPLEQWTAAYVGQWMQSHGSAFVEAATAFIANGVTGSLIREGLMTKAVLERDFSFTPFVARRLSDELAKLCNDKSTYITPQHQIKASKNSNWTGKDGHQQDKENQDTQNSERGGRPDAGMITAGCARESVDHLTTKSTNGKKRKRQTVLSTSTNGSPHLWKRQKNCIKAHIITEIEALFDNSWSDAIKDMSSVQKQSDFVVTKWSNFYANKMYGEDAKYLDWEKKVGETTQHGERVKLLKRRLGDWRNQTLERKRLPKNIEPTSTSKAGLKMMRQRAKRGGERNAKLEGVEKGVALFISSVPYMTEVVEKGCCLLRHADGSMLTIADGERGAYATGPFPRTQGVQGRGMAAP